MVQVGGPKLGKSKFLQSLLPSFQQREGSIPDTCNVAEWNANPELFSATVQLTDPTTKATHNFVLQVCPAALRKCCPQNVLAWNGCRKYGKK